ncbi:thermonuclease family protein [uncultured Sphaerochaeta sp.]|uniref:thermonuclease family protein n=1 Tax=uncultured Sphaerochaeta sp. TaxID=886478 RepID=UPI002A0A1670|nr:thermonuclease family protein [uncultured Sphaerochaeta sp.]
MSKRRILILIILILVSFSIFAAVGSEIVILTKSGKKYHLETCQTLRTSRIPITLQGAVEKGYEPCKVCSPPILDIQANTQSNNPSLYRVNAVALTSFYDADISKMLSAKVDRVVDGDTVKVVIDNPPIGINSSVTIRLLGVDTPETVHPSKPVEYYGKEASDFSAASMEGQTVYLAFDWDLRDSYDRLLAYVYYKNGLCHNALLIQNGYGFANLTYPFQFMGEFRVLQDEAKDKKIGLWK